MTCTAATPVSQSIAGPGPLEPDMTIAVMYLLNWRGEVVERLITEYHSREWLTLVCMGFITHEVTTYN